MDTKVQSGEISEDEIGEVSAFDELCNHLDAAVDERNAFLKNTNTQISNILDVMGKIQKDSLIESIHKTLETEVSDLREFGQIMANLEEQERKLVGDFNKVMANMYLLSGYTFVVVTCISGLLSGEPHICGLLFSVIVALLSFLLALGLSVCFAYMQLTLLLKKYKNLSDDRREQYRRAIADNYVRPKEVNKVLRFQAVCYRKFLWLIMFSGILYAVMVLVTGNCVLCDCKAFSFISRTGRYDY